ncbi:hypothetical protein LJC49_05095 [Ruminococcaceae bacterium OttesenSCG-928-I18]|nr:hypothetical protein [Ruminococcaceae bacterium OttesenSCG-928-I18]
MFSDFFPALLIHSHLRPTENVIVKSTARNFQSFFDEYALQLTVLLDTGRCQNIVASGATAALVGSDSQMTYTVLPGSEKSIAITADVQDFEMEPISINGVRLALDVDIDDEELLEQILELMDGVAELDDGAHELSDGAAELAQGVADLQSGVATMQSGLNTLNGQSATLTSGSAQMKAGLEALGAALNGMSLAAEDLSALVTASAQIKTAIEGLATGTANLQDALSYDAYKAVMAQNGVVIGDLMAGNGAAAQGIGDSISLLTGMRDALPDDNPQKAQLTALIDQLTQVSGLLGANNGVLSGLEGYFGGLYTSADPLVQGAADLNTQYAAFDATIQQMATALGSLPQMMQHLKESVQTLIDEYAKLDSGIGAYTNGVASLVAGYTQLSDGVNKLATGCIDLQTGVDELAEGTGTMREETSGMDETISERIDEILQSVTGDENGEVISFVSARNNDIKRVQFVMRTSGITVNEPEEPVIDEPENLSVWDRFVKLFT